MHSDWSYNSYLDRIQAWCFTASGKRFAPFPNNTENACVCAGVYLLINIRHCLILTFSKTETMSSKDAYMFPVVGSVVLFGLYLAFAWFGKEYVNMVLTAYFLLFGVFALASTLEIPLARLFGKTEKDKTEASIPIPFYGMITLVIVFDDYLREIKEESELESCELIID
jgi:uncharacterized membrane protein